MPIATRTRHFTFSCKFASAQMPPPSMRRAVLQRLWDERVVISHRYTAGVGGLRASVHLYNNQGDVDRLLEAVRREKR